jgi:hypothetical protein
MDQPDEAGGRQTERRRYAGHRGVHRFALIGVYALEYKQASGALRVSQAPNAEALDTHLGLEPDCLGNNGHATISTKAMLLQESERKCPSCSAPTFHRSQPRGGVEQLLFVLGATISRCHACSVRNLYFAGLEIPAKERRDRSAEIALFSIVAGILTCMTIAFLVLRKFHRLPF